MAEPGKITVFAGPMYAGKTSALLDAFANCDQDMWLRTVITKLHDDGQQPNTIKCRDGRCNPAMRLERLWDLAETIQFIQGKCKHIFIDEGQFFPDLVDFCDTMANRGSKVTVAILDSDFVGRAFQSTLGLFSRAEEWHKLRAFCDFCDPEHSGERCAAFTVRVAPLTAEKGYIGQDKDLYKAACRKCFHDRKNNPYLPR